MASAIYSEYTLAIANIESYYCIYYSSTSSSELRS